MTALDPFSFFYLLLALIGCTGLGYVHFATLHSVSLGYLEGHPVRAVLIQVARMAVMVAVLFVLARLGALYLLCGAAGVLVGRFMVMHRVGREP
ncbi:hypothetical protein B2G71_15815 [Novosphingobium sp. PC22D]|uniref:N-ATPase subunit AtpR n=1 Tax=Novosphingobium sp. PC22D TaxID=1962403 RepID=UPI000BF07D49|nr:ATP synthase subunit I [Novosphingobium sp. PC22D]PEQ11595.1 hypothetical protein B2G71_15815 [Novosphingobium sp. PC22D]